MRRWYCRILQYQPRITNPVLGQKRKQLRNVIIPQVCTEVINEMIILAIYQYNFLTTAHPNFMIVMKIENLIIFEMFAPLLIETFTPTPPLKNKKKMKKEKR